MNVILNEFLLQVNFKDNAEFVCEVSDEAMKGQWMKNGQPVKADDRIKIIEAFNLLNYMLYMLFTLQSINNNCSLLLILG